MYIYFRLKLFYMATEVTSKSENHPRRKVALVIGISKYEDGQDLPNAENDAQSIVSALKNIGFLIHTDEAIIDAKRKSLKDVIDAFRSSIKEGDMVVFFFAGHGKQWEVYK